MTDRRRLASNGRIAAMELKGIVTADTYSNGQKAQISVGLADLCRAPDGARDRQLLYGDDVTIYETLENHSFVQSQKDAYVGYVAKSALSTKPLPATHQVMAPLCHIYDMPDIKSKNVTLLAMGSKIHAKDEKNGFVAVREGWIHTSAISSCADRPKDPVAVAARLIGVPYLWGGNSALGIDCSGLVQLSCLICGLECPGDSDMQSEELGKMLNEKDALTRGDLVFWRGHVAWVSGPNKLIHANAYHMATVEEDMKTTLDRIETTGGGRPIGLRRISPLGDVT